MIFEEAVSKLNNEAKQALSKSTSLDGMLKIFADNGLDVTEADIKAAINKQSSELSDDDLANVTGGLDLTYAIQMLVKLAVDKIGDNLNK